MLGEKIREARLNKGYTQAQLGEMVGLTGQVISNIERNYTSTIPLHNADRLSLALGISTYELYTHEPTKNYTDLLSVFYSKNKAVLRELSVVQVKNEAIYKNGKELSKKDQINIRQKIDDLVQAIIKAEYKGVIQNG